MPASEDNCAGTSEHFYDDEAAQTAFFNAPKVTVRSNRRAKTKAKETEDDEEPERETYDENADKELNEKIAQHLKDFFAKKITAKNAFETPILDKLPTVAEMEPLQCVGAMLDASARVYAFRVDNTHCECFNVRTNFDEVKEKKGRENLNDLGNDDSGDESAADGQRNENDDEEDGDDADGDAKDPNSNEGATANGANGEKTKKKKPGLRAGKLDAELNDRLDDLNKKSTKLINRFVRHTLPAAEHTAQAAEPITAETLMEGLNDYSSSMQDIMVSRRVGVPFIEQKMLGLNRASEEYSIDDPIYHKVAKQFEEGCAQSFVNNEVLTNSDGSFLILHTNWRNDEPFTTQTKSLSSQLAGRPYHTSLLLSVEASLDRALASAPCNLPILQEFCEEEEDEKNKTLEKDSTGVRLLGRKSQEAARTSSSVTVIPPKNIAVASTSVQKISEEEQDSEKAGEDESESSNSFTEEEKAHREHEELAKFQMYLDEDSDVKLDIVKDPFNNLNFFPDNFANSYLRLDVVADSAEADKAILHYITEADAAMLDIPQNVLLEIKSILKPNRQIPVELLQSLTSQMAPAKLAQLKILLNVESLYVENTSIYDGVSVSFLVTRFAPLIDSIWHSVVKAADEEDLAKADVFVGGVKNAQRALNRQLHHQAHLQKSASRRRKNMQSTPKRSVSNTPSRAGSRRALGKESQQSSSGVSPPKRQRLDDYDEEDEPNSQFSEFSERVSPQPKEFIYFWARPRSYPIVYLGQVMSENDNPMRHHALEMFVDMEEMLLGLDEANKSSQIDENDGSAEVTEITDTENNSPMKASNADGIAGELLVNVSAQNAKAFIDDTADIGGLEQLDDDFGNDHFDEPNHTIFDNLEDNLKDIADYDNASGDDEPIGEDNALRVPTPDDQSHWKGGVVENGDAAIPAEAAQNEKKTKKKAPTKAKRRRMVSDVNAEMGGSLTDEMLWQPMNNVEPEVTKSIVRHQTNASNLSSLTYDIDSRKNSNKPKLFLERKDFVIDLSGQYNPLQLIKSGLFYESHLGFWRYEKKDGTPKAVFYSHPYNYATPSLDDQTNEFLALYFRDRPAPPPKPLKNGAAEEDHFTNFDPYNLDVPNSPPDFDDGDDIRNDSVDDELGGMARLDDDFNDDNVDMKMIADSEIKMEEQLEFNGGIIKIHQSRVKAPLVKRAMATILSSKELDLKTLNNLRLMYSNMRRASRTHANSDKENQSDETNTEYCVLIDGNLEVTDRRRIDDDTLSSSDDEDDKEGIKDLDNSPSSTSSSSSEDEDAELNQTSPVSKIPGIPSTAADNFTIRGEHTFESLLANLPEHLSGRTKHDLNVINAFAITLHMCNEHQMRLLQDKDEETLIVKPKAMSSFKFQLSEN